jgi:hypothetical protein
MAAPLKRAASMTTFFVASLTAHSFEVMMPAKHIGRPFARDDEVAFDELVGLLIHGDEVAFVIIA